MDVDQAAEAMKDAEIEDFIEGFKQPTWRGMRVNGERVATWSSRDGVVGGQPAGCRVDLGGAAGLDRGGGIWEYEGVPIVGLADLFSILPHRKRFAQPEPYNIFNGVNEAP